MGKLQEKIALITGAKGGLGTSVTQAFLQAGAKVIGVSRSISAQDFGFGHWLDTGGRHRGFVVLRWLDNPTAPDVRVSVRESGERA